jgi:hypothetical protein
MYPVRWKGYLHVIDLLIREQIFLEVTMSAAEMIERQLKSGEGLRGVMFSMCKTKGGAHGRYKVEVLERRAPLEELPMEQDPIDTLRKLWGFSELKNPVK